MTHLVVFDVDGTLVDSMGFDGAIYARTLGEVLGREVDEDWSGYRHVTDSGILEEVLERHSVSDADGRLRREVERRFVAAIAARLAADPGECREIPGARALFDGLRADPRCRVAIATGGWRATALLKLATAGFEIGDTPLATASDAPDRTGIMQIAARRACGDVTPSRCTYFGDGDWDRAACRALGWDFVAIGGRVAHETAFACFSDAAAIRRCLQL
ncbi:MAG: haloacid dehalogenase-like hydrolase [Steroidobacteraceae bacterium]|jgi:beta-phosphoglucomutase-like phosphatase (HAD superfamily)|nr:haloacid dehalogenase-like hydrolase [Steroidobacteraceae bacterium]